MQKVLKKTTRVQQDTRATCIHMNIRHDTLATHVKKVACVAYALDATRFFLYRQTDRHSEARLSVRTVRCENSAMVVHFITFCTFKMRDNTYVQSFHTISVFCDEHHFIIARIQSISSSFIICRKRQSQSKMCTKWNRLSHRSLIIQVLQVLQCSKSHSLAPGFEAFLLCERSRVL